MKLKNANLKSEMEFANRMMDGEVFYLDGWKCAFCAPGSRFMMESPNRCMSRSLGLESYKDMQIEAKWDDDIKEPILCWVSSESGDDRVMAVFIIEKQGEFYIESDDTLWRYATPVTMSDLV